MREGHADESSVRRAYLVVLVIPLALVVATWARAGAGDAYTRVLFPAVVAVYGVLLVGFLTRRLSVRAAGPWVFLSPFVILVGRLVTWELDPSTRPANLELVLAAMAWFGVVFALAFLVFGTRRGAVVSLLSYAFLYMGAGLSAASGMLADLGSREVVAVAGAHAALIAVVWVLARNVEQLSAARARAELLELEATTDPLTGIANRRRLDDELQRLVAQARRYGQPLSAALVDLDRFKEINDTFGHEVGDRVLVSTVERMMAAVRDADLLGRWGGEEFLLLAPHTDHQAACALAERCRRAIAQATVEEDEVTVTASFGVATLGPDDDARALMRRADLALYAAKSEGRDRVVGIPDLTSPSASATSSRMDGVHEDG